MRRAQRIPGNLADRRPGRRALAPLPEHLRVAPLRGVQRCDPKVIVAELPERCVATQVRRHDSATADDPDANWFDHTVLPRPVLSAEFRVLTDQSSICRVTGRAGVSSPTPRPRAGPATTPRLCRASRYVVAGEPSVGAVRECPPRPRGRPTDFARGCRPTFLRQSFKVTNVTCLMDLYRGPEIPHVADRVASTVDLGCRRARFDTEWPLVASFLEDLQAALQIVGTSLAVP